ncbi:RecX family transcriptional regulator [Thermoanaerobacterium sp. RBIITD]|uniref:RecX family transcriptional regulator n=1 Tax=Thermoanaerobacterium sp. RBIITD TaxID=1550240 RepID=UPI000BB89B70|nr:RecX family transcriptional regulator [Thermoanaerobacterium sp. RBIITD]SNX55455.1 regulatory protein [Thermoanaerobacterium sp. RBIITD]
MIITTIERQKKSDKRFNIYIDNEYAFSVSIYEIIEFDLKEGKEINDEQYKYYVNYILEKSAYKEALKYLSYSMRTEKELIDKLRSKDYNESAINNVLLKLRELNYINDAYYTELYIQEKKDKLYSKYRIYNELIRKGIESTLIKKKLEDLYVDEIGTIKKIINKKFKNNNDIIKIKNYLYRSGFKIDDINKVLTDEEVN